MSESAVSVLALVVSAISVAIAIGSVVYARRSATRLFGLRTPPPGLRNLPKGTETVHCGCASTPDRAR